MTPIMAKHLLFPAKPHDSCVSWCPISNHVDVDDGVYVNHNLNSLYLLRTYGFYFGERKRERGFSQFPSTIRKKNVVACRQVRQLINALGPNIPRTSCCSIWYYMHHHHGQWVLVTVPASSVCVSVFVSLSHDSDDKYPHLCVGSFVAPYTLPSSHSPLLLPLVHLVSPNDSPRHHHQ